MPATQIVSAGCSGLRRGSRRPFLRSADLPRAPQAQHNSTAVVIGGAAVLFVDFGIAYAVPTVFPQVSAGLAIPTQHLSALFSIAGALYFLLGLVSGPVADRIGPRAVLAAGLSVMAAGLIATSFAHSELAFEADYCIGIGIGVGLTFVPVIGAVQASWRKNPAVAGGIAASGIGAGTLIVPPLAHLLLGCFGWRVTLQALALLAGGAMVAALAFAGRKTGAENPGGRKSPSPTRGARGQIAASRFVLLYSGQLAISLVAFVPFAHLVPFAKTCGWHAATGVGLISLIGAGGIAGRLLLGFVAKRVGSCRAASLCALLMAVSMAGFTLISRRWEGGSLALLYGLGYGGATGLLGPIVGEVLGAERICQSVGWVATSRALGVLVGPWAAGLLASQLGGYAVPFLTCAIIAFAAMLLFGFLHSLAAGIGKAPAVGLITVLEPRGAT